MNNSKTENNALQFTRALIKLYCWLKIKKKVEMLFSQVLHFPSSFIRTEEDEHVQSYAFGNACRF